MFRDFFWVQGVALPGLPQVVHFSSHLSFPCTLPHALCLHTGSTIPVPTLFTLFLPSSVSQCSLARIIDSWSLIICKNSSNCFSVGLGFFFNSSTSFDFSSLLSEPAVSRSVTNLYSKCPHIVVLAISLSLYSNLRQKCDNVL